MQRKLGFSAPWPRDASAVPHLRQAAAFDRRNTTEIIAWRRQGPASGNVTVEIRNGSIFDAALVKMAATGQTAVTRDECSEFTLCPALCEFAFGSTMHLQRKSVLVKLRRSA